jgi:hypothetical protein
MKLIGLWCVRCSIILRLSVNDAKIILSEFSRTDPLNIALWIRTLVLMTCIILNLALVVWAFAEVKAGRIGPWERSE